MEDRIFTMPNGNKLGITDDDFITGRIEMSLEEIVNASVEGEGTIEVFLDTISEALTGTIFLSEIEYRAVDFNHETSMIVLEITGCISDIINPSDVEYSEVESWG